jgi:hypothetical protein
LLAGIDISWVVNQRASVIEKIIGFMAAFAAEQALRRA